MFSVCSHLGGVRSRQGGGGVRSKVNPAGGSGQRSIQPGGSGPAGGGGGVRSKVNQVGGTGQRSIQPGGSGPVSGGGQHLAPSCGRYASCVHAGGLSC